MITTIANYQELLINYRMKYNREKKSRKRYTFNLLIKFRILKTSLQSILLLGFIFYQNKHYKIIREIKERELREEEIITILKNIYIRVDDSIKR
jgi:hypothetical protein